MISSIINNATFVDWIVMPVLIFVARLIDVSLATIRHILINRGQRKVVPILGFVEVSIWLLAISQVMQNLSNIACFLAWAGGFSLGTYVGMIIEEKLALGYQLVRVITTGNTFHIIKSLGEKHYGVTAVKGDGSRGGVEVLLVISERKRLAPLMEYLHSLDPMPFYTIEDVRTMCTSWTTKPTPGELAMEGSMKRK